ncbi:MAG: DUF58 domain-containing protein [Clostridiales bacterium]|nr:DUF58 domain-containing protein [Clostridiales bacterium]
MTVFIFVLIILAYFVEKWSLEYALRGVVFHYQPSLVLAAPDEKFAILSSLSNHSLRFIPFIRVEEYLPFGLVVYDQAMQSAASPSEYSKLSYSTYMMPYAGFQRSVTASIPERGRYIFPGAHLSGGDFLGLNEERQRVSLFAEVVIYPRESDSRRLEDVMGGFIGDFLVRRFIMEDPVLTAGFRAYTGREPMKAISWMQSARMAEIMVKQYDYTTEASATVLLNVECEEEGKEQRIETCYRLTRSVCRILEERRIQYDFYTNATTSGAIADWAYIGEGLGEKHYFTIMEGLGRASYRFTESFSAMVKRMKTRGAKALIIITPTDREQIMARLNRENAMQLLILPAEEAVL